MQGAAGAVLGRAWVPWARRVEHGPWRATHGGPHARGSAAMGQLRGAPCTKPGGRRCWVGVRMLRSPHAPLRPQALSTASSRPGPNTPTGLAGLERTQQAQIVALPVQSAPGQADLGHGRRKPHAPVMTPPMAAGMSTSHGVSSMVAAGSMSPPL